MQYTLSLKGLLLKAHNWYKFHKQHHEDKDIMRDTVKRSITQVISCRKTIRGYSQYKCENKECTHQKRVAYSCKNRICNSCGRKATEQWIENQLATLPNCMWQHVTTTMPDKLWSLFKINRHLLNALPKLAADALMTFAKKSKNIRLGIFIAVHTFGRDLKWNTHTHVSTTLGGLSYSDNTWVDFKPHKLSIMKMWRFRVINLLREAFKANNLLLPEGVTTKQLYQLLDNEYNRHWHVHFAEPKNDPRKDLEYLSRYVKRSPIANSRIKYYDDKIVVFQYLDHRSKRHRTFRCTPTEFINRFIQHIHEPGFRIIRYYGFLANRVRSKLLPIVQEIFGTIKEEVMDVTYAFLLEKSYGQKPFECILCRSEMQLEYSRFGASNSELLRHHDKLAQNKIIRL